MGAQGCFRQFLSHFQCRMLGDLLSPGADMWMWRISQGTAHSEEMLHLLLLAPELGAPFYPPISWHITALPLSLLPQPHQTCQKQQLCQPSPSIQGRSNQEDNISTGKKKTTQNPHNIYRVACTGKQQKLNSKSEFWQKQGEVRTEHKRKDSQLFHPAYLKHVATSCQRDVWSAQLLCLGGTDSVFYSFPKPNKGEKEKRTYLYLSGKFISQKFVS